MPPPATSGPEAAARSPDPLSAAAGRFTAKALTNRLRQAAWAARPDAADAAVAQLWRCCYSSSIFRHDSFEPILATLAFFPPLIFFFCLDVWVPSVRCFTAALRQQCYRLDTYCLMPPLIACHRHLITASVNPASMMSARGFLERMRNGPHSSARSNTGAVGQPAAAGQQCASSCWIPRGTRALRLWQATFCRFWRVQPRWPPHPLSRVNPSRGEGGVPMHAT